MFVAGPTTYAPDHLGGFRFACLYHSMVNGQFPKINQCPSVSLVLGAQKYSGLIIENVPRRIEDSDTWKTGA